MDKIINLLIEHGLLGIILAAFSEAIFFPIPMELISIPVYLSNPNNALLYSIVLILFSTIGSFVGYYLGKFFGKSILEKFISDKRLNKIKILYDKNSFWAILTSLYTPIPYEVYVLSAGMFNIGLRKFIFASSISRILRHLPQGIIIFLYKDALLSHLKNYTLVISLFFIITIVLLNYLFFNKKSDEN